jgi:hypothetical protein
MPQPGPGVWRSDNPRPSHMAPQYPRHLQPSAPHRLGARVKFRTGAGASPVKAAIGCAISRGEKPDPVGPTWGCSKVLSPEATCHVLPKPKGMHGITYDRLSERHDAYDTMCAMTVTRYFRIRRIAGVSYPHD